MNEQRIGENGPTTEELEWFGYKEELKRDFTLWSVFALAFAFISPIVALYAIFGLAFAAGGPAFWDLRDNGRGRGRRDRAHHGERQAWRSRVDQHGREIQQRKGAQMSQQPRNETTGEPGSTSDSHDPQFAAELERRLSVIEEPNYEDAARENLPALDYLLLAALVVVTTVVAYVWGF